MSPDMLVGLSLVQGKQPKPLKDCHQLVCVWEEYWGPRNSF